MRPKGGRRDTTAKKSKGTGRESCQIQGCTNVLGKAIFERYRVCEFHSKEPCVEIDGGQYRYCQQCTKFHSLDAFDGANRGCRMKLMSHNRRRRNQRRQKLQNMSMKPAAEYNSDDLDFFNEQLNNVSIPNAFSPEAQQIDEKLLSEDATADLSSSCVQSFLPTSVPSAPLSLSPKQGSDSSAENAAGGGSSTDHSPKGSAQGSSRRKPERREPSQPSKALRGSLMAIQSEMQEGLPEPCTMPGTDSDRPMSSPDETTQTMGFSARQGTWQSLSKESYTSGQSPGGLQPNSAPVKMPTSPTRSNWLSPSPGQAPSLAPRDPQPSKRAVHRSSHKRTRFICAEELLDFYGGFDDWKKACSKQPWKPAPGVSYEIWRMHVCAGRECWMCSWMPQLSYT